MPPEVAMSLPSNETVDAYSFALVMWEMVTIEQPFQFYGVNELLRMCVFFLSEIQMGTPINSLGTRSNNSIKHNIKSQKDFNTKGGDCSSLSANPGLDL